MFSDNADRLIAAADAGTNGGTAWTRPGTAPASSATVLVTTYAYTYYAPGLYVETHDPMGIDAHTNYDNLGRLVRIIQNYTGQAETTQSDVATYYYYDGNNNSSHCSNLHQSHLSKPIFGRLLVSRPDTRRVARSFRGLLINSLVHLQRDREQQSQQRHYLVHRESGLGRLVHVPIPISGSGQVTAGFRNSS